MDKDQVLPLQNGGHGLKPAPDFRIGLAQVVPEAGQILPLLKAPLPGHLAQDALRVLGEEPGEEPLVPGAVLQKPQHIAVAVAADGVDGMGFLQLQHIPGQLQALGALFQNVPQKNENVLG